MADKSKIELTELIEVLGIPQDTSGSREPHWKITLSYKPMLYATWYLPKREFPDSAVLSIARNYFHNLCAALGEATSDWSLNDAQISAMKRQHPSTHPSSDPA